MTSNSTMFPDNMPSRSLCRDVSQMNGLSLAFIGDAVFELLIREYVLSQGEKKVKDMHSMSISFANADFQAHAGDVIAPYLTENEQAVFRRGKNAHSAHTPKNKTTRQYHKATAFEALIGSLYLNGDNNRIYELFDIIIKDSENNTTDSNGEKQ